MSLKDKKDGEDKLMFTFREAEGGERKGERGEMRRGRKGRREREKGMKTEERMKI